MVVVKYKYAPIAAACLSLCTGVAASVIAKRQIDGDVAGIDLGLANGALGPTSPSSASSSGSAHTERAVSNRATAAAAADSSPAFTFGGTGNVPGTTNENRALVALTPGTTVTYDGVNGLSLSQLATTADLLSALTALLVALTGITTSAAPLPAPASGTAGTLSSTIAQAVATLTSLLSAAPTLGLPNPTSAVPPSVTNQLAPLLALLTPLLGSTGVSTSDPLGTAVGVVNTIGALLPVLTALVGSMSAVGL